MPPLWAAFLPRLREISNTVPGACYGVVQPSAGELLDYVAAIAVTKINAVPPGMDVVTVPAATYAKFTHQGHAKAIDHTVNYAYSTWLTQSGKQHTYGPDLEIYGAGYHPTSEGSVMYYAIPVVEHNVQP